MILIFWFTFFWNEKIQTKKSMESNFPYVVLGVLYAYLLFLSWTPETVRLIFASKYLLPEVHIHSFSSMKLSFLSRKSSIIKLITIHICILHHAAYQHRKNVLQWVDFSFCMDSPFGCRSFCCKVLQLFIYLYLSAKFSSLLLIFHSKMIFWHKFDNKNR
jgi:hypothetical protein